MKSNQKAEKIKLYAEKCIPISKKKYIENL